MQGLQVCGEKCGELKRAAELGWRDTGHAAEDLREMARVAFASRSSTGKLPAGSLGASVLLIQFHFDLFPRNAALGIAPMLLQPPVEFVGLCGSERRFMAFAGDTFLQGFRQFDTFRQRKSFRRFQQICIHGDEEHGRKCQFFQAGHLTRKPRTVASP